MRLKSKVLERFKGYERSNEIVSASPSGFRDNAVPATTSYLSALAATPALKPEYPMGLEKENLPNLLHESEGKPHQSCRPFPKG